MLGDQVWPTVIVPVQHKGVGQTGETGSFWTWLCARGHCHVETVKGPTQTVNTSLYSPRQWCLHAFGHTVLIRIKK